ncbi:MAG: hypothetical protein U0401_36070, partial [Anaerolineae bacterium]
MDKIRLLCANSSSCFGQNKILSKGKAVGISPRFAARNDMADSGFLFLISYSLNSASKGLPF